MGFILGVSLIWWIPDLITAWFLSLFFALLACLVIKLKQASKWLLSVSIGLCWVTLFSQLQVNQQLSKVLKSYQTTIQISGLIKTKHARQQFTAKDLNTEQKWLVNWYKDTESSWQSGDTLSVVLDIKPPSGTVNHEGFDRERWLFREGIDGVATLKSWQLISQQTGHPLDIINRWRMQTSRWIDERFSEHHAVMIKALSIGDKSGFDREDYQRFQMTGTAHLVAISGLHIGIVAMVGHALGWLLFLFYPFRRWPRPNIQALSAWLLAVVYACMAGLAIPTVRAIVMLSVYLWLRVIRRNAWPWDVWTFSLFLLLLFDPLMILDIGLALSFGAVAVLILLFQGKKKVSAQVAFIKTQFGLLMGLMPFQIALYGSFQWITPLVNLLVIPLMTVAVVPLLFVLMTVHLVVDAELLWLEMMLQWFLDLFDAILQFFTGFHDTLSISMSMPASWQWFLLLVGLIGFLLSKAVPQRQLFLLMLIPAFWPMVNRPDLAQFSLRFFDVGQGLSVWVRTKNHNMVYDVGAQYDSGFSWAEAVVLPELKSAGVVQLDALILSHRDNDHAGGMSSLIQGIDVVKIYGSDSGQTPCVSGLSWEWDEVLFEVISPYNFQPYLGNDSSCVLKISSQDGAVLLTGDIETAVEYRLVENHVDEIKADVLLMPHHGSKTSSSEAFIKAVKPHWVINSSGKYNSFNHPHSDVVVRYDSPIYDTQSLGQITVTSGPQWQVSSLRQDRPKIWRMSSDL